MAFIGPLTTRNVSTDYYHSHPKTSKAEDAFFSQQVQETKKWWDSPRFEGLKRTYTAEDVVSKRGDLIQTYPSSVMARKLFHLLKARAAAGQPVHTRLSFRHQA